MVTKEDLNARIALDKDTRCFHWTASFVRNRPVLYKKGKTIYVRSYVYEWRKGLIPSGFHVIMICGNPDCVNPEHMEIKTNLRPAKHPDSGRL